MIPNPKHNMFSTNDFTSAKPLVNNKICRYIQLQITVSNIDDNIKPSIVLKKDSHRDWDKGISISNKIKEKSSTQSRTAIGFRGH